MSAKHNSARDENDENTVAGEAGGKYTCPMHPEVVSDEPGDCPKCGMHLVPMEQAGTSSHSGHSHHHSGHSHQCSGEHEKPSGDDRKYDRVPPGYSGVVYTCPMHPQVRQTKPGACPICGMGLETESAAVDDEGPNPELVDFSHRLWVALAFSVPLLILTMTPYILSLIHI